MAEQCHRRKLIQLAVAVLYNANFKGFAAGTISKGVTKGVCVPGLNCYSCPGAIGACPIGALQSSLNNFPERLPLYVLGSLILFGVLFGRVICGFLCPMGMVQELLYKIPSPKIKKSRITASLTWLKYVILIVLVVWAPLHTLWITGVVDPAFCKFVCPAGTLEAGLPLISSNEPLQALIGVLFARKVVILIGFLIISVFLYRPFCRFFCPLGAIYSLFNGTALFGVKVDKNKCTHCGACVSFCKMDVKCVNDRECIRCGECAKRCGFGAIKTMLPASEKKAVKTQSPGPAQ